MNKQEKQDLNIAKFVLKNSSTAAAIAILNQSDRALELRTDSSDRAQKYVNTIVTKAENNNNISPQSNNQIDR